LAGLWRSAKDLNGSSRWFLRKLSCWRIWGWLKKLSASRNSAFILKPGFEISSESEALRNPNIERIAALKPDLILANKEENRQEDIEALQAIAPVWVSEIGNLDEALDMIRRVASICGKTKKGDEIAKTIENGFKRLETGPALRVAYGIGRSLDVGRWRYLH
jgi:hypothetical protein